MISIDVTIQQTTVVSTTTTTAPVKPPRLKAVEQQWQMVQANNAPLKPPRLKATVQTVREKKVLSEEEIREQMGAVGRAIEDHPNIYAGVTILGVLSAFYGLCANIVGTEGVNLALTRVLTNLTNCF